jgi:hypothetical protein
MNKKNKIDKKSENKKDAEMETAEQYYKKGMRILEYYVLICFILVTFVPLLDFGWVPAFVKLIYFTGFPLLILIFIISLFKEPVKKMIANLLKK